MLLNTPRKKKQKCCEKTGEKTQHSPQNASCGQAVGQSSTTSNIFTWQHSYTQLHTHAHSCTHTHTATHTHAPAKKRAGKKNNWKRACTARWSITNRHARHTNQRQSSQTMVSAHKSRKQKCETTHAQQSRETEKSATCVVKKKTKKTLPLRKKCTKTPLSRLSWFEQRIKV